MFFWNSVAFSVIQQMLAIGSLVPLAFLNPAWTSGSSQFMYCWSLAWRVLSVTLLVCEMSTIVWQFKHSLALPFFRSGMKTDLFQSCGHWWVFQIYWHIECSPFTASSFRISVQFSCSVVSNSLRPHDRSTSGLLIHHQLPESTQTHDHWVGNAIQPSCTLLSLSPPALNLSQHQGLFKWVSSSHQVAKVLDFQL